MLTKLFFYFETEQTIFYKMFKNHHIFFTFFVLLMNSLVSFKDFLTFDGNSFTPSSKYSLLTNAQTTPNLNKM